MSSSIRSQSTLSINPENIKKTYGDMMYLGGREMVHGIKWVKVTNAALRKQSLG